MYKIALCDDERRALNLLSKIIDYSAIGFEVKATFTRGKDLIEYLKENPLDAVITDIKMPGMSGIELAEIIHRDFPQTKVVLISAYRDFEYAHTAFKYDVVSYITKPITQSDFIEGLLKLKNLLDISRAYTKSENEDITPCFEENSIPECVQTALGFIKEHYADDITLEDAAANSFMHPGYLSQLIKKYTNGSYIDFLTATRIKKAKELLRETDDKIYIIGVKVGYKYSQYFHKIFKSSTGETPQEYRQRYRKGRRKSDE